MPEFTRLTTSAIGQGLPRLDGPIKVQGHAVYAGDITLQGMLHGKILRSPHPHALIRQLDTSKARSMPGVVAVLTGMELDEVRFAFLDTPRYPADQHPLCRDRARYIGDEVAVVVADSEDTAQEALDLIRVEYEILPAVLTPDAALAPDAPLLHPYTGEFGHRPLWSDWGAAPAAKQVIHSHGNISGHTMMEYGDVEQSLATAAVIRHDRYETQTTAHVALEPHVALASFDRDAGKLEVWLSSMGVFYKRYLMARSLGMPVSKVRVHGNYVGGAFGGKIDLFPFEFCAAYLARRLHRPVRIALTREEVMHTTRLRHPATIEVTTGAQADGQIIAQDLRVTVDNGAYRGSGALVIYLCHAFSLPLLEIPNYRYEGTSVYTNNPVRGPQRGHGAPQVRFALDSHLDQLARDLGLDLPDLLLRNLRQPGTTLPNGDVLNSYGLEDCIQKALASSGWQAKRGCPGTGSKRKGIGLSIASMFSGTPLYPFGSAAVVRLQEDGSATLYTGAVENGQGAHTTLAQIVAEVLTIPLAQINLVAADTDLTPEDLGSFLSGGALVTGSAVQEAAADARRLLLEAVAPLLQVQPEELTLAAGMVHTVNSSEPRLSFAQAIQLVLSRNHPQPLIGRGYRKAVPPAQFPPSLANARGRFTDAYGFAAQVAEVEVDTQTGKVEVTRLTTYHDCGFPLNEQIVSGQLDGSVVMGLGQAVCEEILWEGGQMLNPNLRDYLTPLAPGIPQLNHGLIHTHEPAGPFGAKEVGEGAVAGILAAVANAVTDAVGVRMHRLPLTPDAVLAALKKQESGIRNQESE